MFVRFLARRVLELIVGINMLVALFQQWIIPSVRNSLEPFSASAAAPSRDETWPGLTARADDDLWFLLRCLWYGCSLVQRILVVPRFCCDKAGARRGRATFRV